MKTSSLNVVLNNNYFHILYMILRHSGAKCKLPTRNSEEPQIGMIHQDQGNYEEAVKKYNQSLKIEEELGNKRGIASTLYQIGRINKEQGECSSALRNYLTSYSIFDQLNSPNKDIVSRSLSRLRDKMEEKEFDAEHKRLVNE